MPIPVSQILKGGFSPSGNFVSYSKQYPTLSGVRDLRANFVERSAPVWSYAGGVLSRADYIDGSYKTFFYSGTLLTRADFNMTDSRVYRQDLVYLADNSLSGIIESLI